MIRRCKIEKESFLIVFFLPVSSFIICKVIERHEGRKDERGKRGRGEAGQGMRDREGEGDGEEREQGVRGDAYLAWWKNFQVQDQCLETQK
jgi:hypothetical protein